MIIENCKSKIETFESLMDERPKDSFKYTLVYCTAKQPEQLKSVNELLRQKAINFHQLTEKETSSRLDTNRILENFKSGKIQVLTAKKVLDEGVNVPQICEAFIIASTTVEREWIQRRGRLLRKCKEIDKEKAIIHDFAVLPQLQILDKDSKKIIDSERKRVWEFAKHSLNFFNEGGANASIQKWINY